MNVTVRESDIERTELFLSELGHKLSFGTEDDLRRQWEPRYDRTRTPEENLYSFSAGLAKYAYEAQRWEDSVNGGDALGERVKDKFLMPAVVKFMAALKDELK